MNNENIEKSFERLQRYIDEIRKDVYMDRINYINQDLDYIEMELSNLRSEL